MRRLASGDLSPCVRVDPLGVGRLLHECANRLAELEKDTERLDWLERNGQSVSPTFETSGRWVVRDDTVLAVSDRPRLAFGDSIREAIDAARAPEDKP